MPLPGGRALLPGKSSASRSVIGGIINIPVSIYLAKDLNMGPAGVALGSIFSLSFFAICGPIVSYINLRKLRK